MLMVIFGAGASYDSFPTSPPTASEFLNDRLPLAAQLFDNRDSFGQVINQFPDCRPIIAELRHCAPTEGVEIALERIQTENANDIVGQREITAVRYYLQKIIWQCEDRWQTHHHGVTNYSQLLRQIRIHCKDEAVCFVTFNYDTMLEKAMPTLNRTIKMMRDYLDARFSIFKVHGSVNWGKIITWTPFDVSLLAGSDVPKNVIRHAAELSKYVDGDDFEIMGDFDAHKTTADGDVYALFPAIAIPVENKTHFELPSKHMAELKRIIPQVTKVLIIGWRATDKPFLELFEAEATHEILVHIVCEVPTKGDDVLANIQKCDGIKMKEYRTDYEGFSNFVTSGKAEAFLKL